MAYFTPGNTVDMGEMRDNLAMPGGTVTMTGIRDRIIPYNYLNLGAFAQFNTAGIWRYRLEISIPGGGFVQSTYPNNTGQSSQVTTAWFRSADYTYASIYCQPYYPYTFIGWRYGYGGSYFSSSLAPNVNWNATTELVLYAVII